MILSQKPEKPTILPKEPSVIPPTERPTTIPKEPPLHSPPPEKTTPVPREVPPSPKQNS